MVPIKSRINIYYFVRIYSQLAVCYLLHLTLTGWKRWDWKPFIAILIEAKIVLKARAKRNNSGTVQAPILMFLKCNNKTCEIQATANLLWQIEQDIHGDE